MSADSTTKSCYEFKYKCDAKEIDIRTLLDSQACYLEMLNEIQNSFFQDARLYLRITAIKPGSVDVCQIVELVAVSGHIIFTNAPVADLFNIIQGYFNLCRIYANANDGHVEVKEKAIDVDGRANIIISGNNNINLIVSNSYGDTSIVDSRSFAAYQSSQIMNECCKKMSKIVLDDPRVDGIDITDLKSKQRVWSASREDFQVYQRAKNNFLEKQNDSPEIIYEEIDNVELRIRRPDFEPKKVCKWDFLCENECWEKVTISDDEFIEKINNGEPFGKGYILRVRIKITKHRHGQTNLYIPKDYEIIKVHEIKSPEKSPQQGQLFSQQVR